MHRSSASLGPEARAWKGPNLSLGAAEAGSQGHSEGGMRGTFILEGHQSIPISASCRDRAQTTPSVPESSDLGYSRRDPPVCEWRWMARG